MIEAFKAALHDHGLCILDGSIGGGPLLNNRILVNNTLIGKMPDIKRQELSDEEIKVVRRRLRHTVGDLMADLSRVPLPTRIGQHVIYRAHLYRIYDYDADASAPRGITLTLLSADNQYLVNGVKYVDIRTE